VLISANAAWNIVNFRAALVRALIADGHEVVAAVGGDAALPDLRAMGVRAIVVPMVNASASPIHDARLLARFGALIRRERPDVFLGWTIKPNIYGTLAATLCGVPVINNISGLGTAFIRTGWLTRIVKRLYWLALRRSTTVFFQNADDRALFLAERLIQPNQARLIPGSGIDTAAFDPDRYPLPDNAVFRFLLIARLIRDKGVLDYVEAARRLIASGANARFQILGFLDVDNRTAIPRAELHSWITEGVIDYLGAAEDVRPIIARADCVVLPSYREGASRVLLEAAAMARPAIASDVPGCRDIVEDRSTGFLCRVRDPVDLANRMQAMLDLTPTKRIAMGQAARAHVITRFGEAEVVARYREAIAQALAGGAAAD
jgi:glycosyltransferase involved in cell wall biosynthesis